MTGPFVWLIVVVPPQLSEAVAVPVFAGSVLALHWIVTSTGHVIAGAVFVTTIVCVHVAVFMQLSVAVHVRWIV
jgi:hypothetical protein